MTEPQFTTRLSRLLPASPGVVYRALIDPALVARWRFPEGMSCRVLEWDARRGGRFRVELTYDVPDGSGKTTAASDVYSGRFLDLVPGRTVVEAMRFETRDPEMLGDMTVRTALVEAGGGTEIRVEHSGVPAGVSQADNAEGWRMAIARLERLLSGG